MNEPLNNYQIVAMKIKQYCDATYYGDCIVSFEQSYDNIYYEKCIEYVTVNFDYIEYLNDWWEGQEYIRNIVVKHLDEITL